jgi:hypothetical protein
MPTGPANSNYIIPTLTLSDTFYEWYTLTNNEIIDKLNRLKVYQISGASGICASQGSDGIVTVSFDNVVPGDHTFTGNITFDGTVTTVNTNLVTIDDYNLVLGAVNSSGGTGGTSDAIITNAGGGGLVIAGACGDKYFLWKAFDGGKTYTAWRISDSLAFAGDAKLYSANNKFVLSEGSDNTPASKLMVTTHGSGSTIDIETYFDSPGKTYGAISFMSDGSSRMINSSLIKRFEGITTAASAGITFGVVVRHNINTGGLTLAKADSAANAESLGIVVGVNGTAETVDVSTIGYVSGNFANAIDTNDSMSNLGTGEFYFLSTSQAGKITKTAPSATGTIRKPILYALGGDKAMVMNYVGNKNVDIDSLYSKLNASNVVIKHDANFFSIGDAVRFEEGITSATFPYGSYVKAANNSVEQAEALGIISKVNYGGNSAASLMTVSGYIDLSGSGQTFNPGAVYFLGTEAGSLTESTPISVGSVRKPMLVAVTPTAGIVQNYVGLVLNSGSGSGTNISASGSAAKNKLINGNFDFWQRGSTFGYRNPSTESDRYNADRWKLVNSGSVAGDRLGIQINRLPLGLGDLDESSAYSKYGLEMAIGTGGYTAGSYTYLFQRVEGIEHLPRGTATVSFYAKASIGNAKLGVSFRRDFGGGTAPDYATTGVERNSQKVPGFVMNVPTNWTRFSHTFSLPDCAGGILGTGGNDGPEIQFYLRAGSDLVGEDVTEAINPNIAGTSSYSISIAQVQLESGSVSSLFEPNEKSAEFTACQRYYQTNANTTSLEMPYRDHVDGGPFFDATMLDFGPSGLGTPEIIFLQNRMRNANYNLGIKTSNLPSNSLLSLAATTKTTNGFRVVRLGSVSQGFTMFYEAEAEL